MVTSKVVSITEQRIKQATTQEDFDKIVKQESDQLLGGSQVTLTIKNNIFTPWAGIDNSNVPTGKVVLWPKNPFKTAHEIQTALRKHYKLNKLGIIITDSYCAPLRRGVTAIAIGYAGFHGVKNYIGKKDIHGNATLKMTKQNTADLLSAAAHLEMGEGNEKTPFALIKNAKVTFTNKPANPKESIMPAQECLFAPLYKKIPGLFIDKTGICFRITTTY